MEMPSHIRDFLQTNYFVPAAELDKPLDEMQPSVRDLITSKCLSSKGFISESETLEVAKNQALEDIDADICANRSAQVDRFVENHKSIESLMTAAAKLSDDHSPFDRVADVLAAKRLVSDEYADKPKSAAEFLHAKSEIKQELNVKYWTARYYNARPAAQSDAETIDDVAEIARMIYSNQSDQIAARFDLPDTKADRDAAMGATLGCAMADAKTFSDKVKARLKDSAFVRRVEGLNGKFQQKFPKTYIASKIASNGAAAIVLGPVFSAFKAATTVAAMRKDFAKYKQESGEKGSVFEFLKTGEGRQKLMTFGQNTLRMIPGARAAGIALGAIKNSDSLVSSIKEIKQNGGSKKAWLKVAACTAGLLAVATTAAYANDEVAESVNTFVHDHLGKAVEKAYEVADEITASNHSAQTVFTGDEWGHQHVNVDNDGNVSAHANWNTLPDKTQDGITVTHVGYDTDNGSGKIAATDNKSGVIYSASTHDNASEFKVGVEKGVSDYVYASTDGGIRGQATDIKINDNTTIEGVRADTHGRHGSMEVRHDGTRYQANVKRSGASVSRDLPGGHATVEADKGGVNGHFNINRQIDKDKDGFTVTHMDADTRHGSAGIKVGDNKSDVIYSASTRDNASEFKVGVEKGVSDYVYASTDGGIRGQATDIKINDNTTIEGVRADTHGRHGSMEVRHDGTRYQANIKRSGASVSRDLPDGHATVEADKSGVNARVNTNVDKSLGGGFKLTRITGNTANGDGSVSVVNENSGREIKVSGSKQGSGSVSISDKDRMNGTTVSVDRKGDVSIGRSNGRKINISDVIRRVKRFTR